MNNYRVNISKSQEKINISYWNLFSLKDKEIDSSKINFIESNNYFYPFLKKIFNKAKRLGIVDIWFFYELEPNIEITWLSTSLNKSNSLYQYIKNISKKEGFINIKYLTPKDGKFGDWYHINEKEREFGAKRHKICCDFVKLYNEYKDDVDSGKGLENQVKRTIHTLCNPLGLNYKQEANICFWRFIECKSFSSKTIRFLFRIYRKYINKKYQ